MQCVRPRLKQVAQTTNQLEQLIEELVRRRGIEPVHAQDLTSPGAQTEEVDATINSSSATLSTAPTEFGATQHLLEHNGSLVKYPDVHLDQFLEGTKLQDAIPNPSSQTSQSSTCVPLPPAELGSTLFFEFLSKFNSKIPLFSPAKIRSHLQACYTGKADGKPLSWVATYTILAIAHRLRAMTTTVPDAADDNKQADKYLTACVSNLPDLLLQKPTVLLVQALLGVSLLLQTSHRSRSASLFVSTAMRMVLDMGYNELNEDRETLTNSTKDVREQQYVFWIAFFMDTHLHFSSRRPGACKLTDISTAVPNVNLTDWWDSRASGNGQWNVNIFSLHVQLAIIEAEAFEEIFSTKARRQCENHIASSRQASLRKLEFWRRSNQLFSMQPAEMKYLTCRSDLLHIVILESTYFGVVFQLESGHALRSSHAFSGKTFSRGAQMSSQSGYEDACRLLSLVASVTQTDLSMLW